MREIEQPALVANDDVEGDEVEEEEQEEDDGDREQDDEKHVQWSACLGWGNIKTVRNARVEAGLNEAFSLKDPLLVGFASFEAAQFKVPRDISNKVRHIYISVVKY